MQYDPVHDKHVGRTPKRRRLDKAEDGHAQGQIPLAEEKSTPKEKSFGDVSVSGNGYLWQGDHYGPQIHHHYPSHQSSQHDKYHILLESLTFDRMNARLRNVATALSNTCQWLQRHRDFCAWADPARVQEHGGFSWIKGKPGSGKSTVMKTIVGWAEQAWDTQITLTYFFNARSPDQLEKSSLGLYRSLVYQILEACPDNQALFMTKFGSKERQGKLVSEWTETEL